MIISRLRNFYRTHLARYAGMRLARNVAFRAYQTFGAISRAFVWVFASKSFRAVPLSQFCTDSGYKWDCVCFGGKTEIAAPLFFGRQPDGRSAYELEQPQKVVVDLLDVFVTEIPKVTAIGGTNFMIQGDVLIHPDQYVPAREICPAESFGVAKYEEEKGRLSLLVNGKAPRAISGINLLGQCTGNYAHWLTETLPKLLICDAFKAYEGVPLLMDAWIHPVFYETIAVLGNKKREIVRVERWQKVRLDDIVQVSATAYIPAGYRSFVRYGAMPKMNAGEFSYSLQALNMLRDRARRAVDGCGIRYSKQLYLRRASAGNERKVLNAPKIERLVKAYGLQILEPGAMSFSDQVRAFRDAELIVAPIGAALANAIFAAPGCTVIALAPFYNQANYDYYSQLLGLLGHKLYYVISPQPSYRPNPANQSYLGDTESLRALFEVLQKKERPMS